MRRYAFIGCGDGSVLANQIFDGPGGNTLVMKGEEKGIDVAGYSGHLLAVEHIVQ